MGCFAMTGGLVNSLPMVSAWTPLFQCEWIPAQTASVRLQARTSGRSALRSKQKLMIVLHGYGDSLKPFRSIGSELKIPGMNYLLLNAPKKLRDGYSWCPLAPRRGRGLRTVRNRLFALVEELKNAGWSTRDIYWLGHSQGCLVAADLLLHHPDTFGGFIGVSGYVWFYKGWRRVAKASGAGQTPWLFTHGRRDRVIPPGEIREDILELTRGAGLSIMYREFGKGHDFDHRFEVPFIREWMARPRAQRLAAGRRSLSTAVAQR
jgi:phospholipase/carboxylesterase